jgi:hypothetical protein
VDVQEALKLLQHRLGKQVFYRPVALRQGSPVYRVDGELLTEREILEWVASLGGRADGRRRSGDLRLTPRASARGAA